MALRKYFKERTVMTNYTALDAYRSHELNIQMRTSSGDVINMDYLNESSLSMQQEKSTNSSKSSFSFASHQAFNFSMTGNGLDEQDKKEIAAFMEIAQPYIDKFMSELEGDEQHTPFNRVASQVDAILSPLKNKTDDVDVASKNGIVEMFDKAAQNINDIDKIFEQASKLLERILEDFDKMHEEIYA